ncbi:MAG: ATP synthase subunit C [Synergistetes bacterium]|nr:ATP synthase subunit C [Synergistota bacterium]MDW8191736.1 ATP synthase subunit C [Synergistota bacterium]
MIILPILIATGAVILTIYGGLTIRKRKDYKTFAQRIIFLSSMAILASLLLLFLIPTPGMPSEGRSEKEAITSPKGLDRAAGYLGAAIAVGAATIGAGLAVSSTGSAMIGAMAEKPELIGRALIVVALAEGIAIYGMVIAIMIIATL